MTSQDVDFDVEDEGEYVEPKATGMTWEDDGEKEEEDDGKTERQPAGALFGARTDTIGRKFDDAQKDYRQASNAYGEYIKKSGDVLKKLDARRDQINRKLKDARAYFAKIKPQDLPKGRASAGDLETQLANFGSSANGWLIDIKSWRDHVSSIASQRTARTGRAELSGSESSSTSADSVPRDAVEKGKHLDNGLIVHTHMLGAGKNTETLATGVDGGVYIHASGPVEIKAKPQGEEAGSRVIEEKLGLNAGIQLKPRWSYSLRNSGSKAIKVSYIGRQW